MAKKVEKSFIMTPTIFLGYLPARPAMVYMAVSNMCFQFASRTCMVSQEHLSDIVGCSRRFVISDLMILEWLGLLKFQGYHSCGTLCFSLPNPIINDQIVEKIQINISKFHQEDSWDKLVKFVPTYIKASRHKIQFSNLAKKFKEEDNSAPF